MNRREKWVVHKWLLRKHSQPYSLKEKQDTISHLSVWEKPTHLTISSVCEACKWVPVSPAGGNINHGIRLLENVAKSNQVTLPQDSAVPLPETYPEDMLIEIQNSISTRLPIHCGCLSNSQRLKTTQIFITQEQESLN